MRVGVVALFIVLVVIVLGSFLSGGCAAPKKDQPAPAAVQTPVPQSASPTAAIGNTDPCAMRMHEVCGALLLYFATHRDLPANVEELKKSPGAEAVGDMTCPVSHKPYVYNPVGIPSVYPAARIVLYDPEPSHDGMRLAVSVMPPQGGAPLVAKVVPIPESKFLTLLSEARQ